LLLWKLRSKSAFLFLEPPCCAKQTFALVPVPHAGCQLSLLQRGRLRCPLNGLRENKLRVVSENSLFLLVKEIAAFSLSFFISVPFLIKCLVVQIPI